MNNVRALFRCTTKTSNIHTSGVNYGFQPMYDDKTPEHQRYAKYTPTGKLEMLVDNPAVEFELGAYYYLDIVAVEAPEPAQV